jgi:light-regulated signal transduction histidine kinase (bacteriophytochrome)
VHLDAAGLQMVDEREFRARRWREAKRLGIEPEQLDHLFEPFSSSKGHAGTGLGLAVARKIVDEHHGRIDVQSTPGEGTTFTVTFSARPQGPDAMERTHGPGARTGA